MEFSFNEGVSPSSGKGNSVSSGSSPLAEPDAGTLERAAEATRLMRDFSPFDGFLLAAWDPFCGAHYHVPLACDGYSERIIRHGCDEYVTSNSGFLLARNGERRGLRWKDIAKGWGVDFRSTFIAQEYLLPAGFKEGMTACLWAPDGRYTGALSVSWDRASGATDDARDMIERFRPVLASICDLLTRPAAIAQSLAPAAHAVMVTSNGSIRELPGRTPGAHLADGGELARFVGKHRTGLAPGRFLWIDGEGQYHRTDLFDCDAGAFLVAEQNVQRPYGFTTRELEILHLLSTGATNGEIAERLIVSVRTVATHIEHILAKSPCQNRVQLTSLAVDRGFRLLKGPAQLVS